MPRKPPKINVTMEDGNAVMATVLERLGFNHDVGRRAIWCGYEGKEFMAVCVGGFWRKWGAKDRVKPMIEHLERCLKNGEKPFL